MSIPKKIHYVWVGPKPIPAADLAYMETWQKLNPDFKIIQWDETKVDHSKYPLVQKALDEKRYALASDILRMIIIYQEGGIYLDTDVELLQPLESLTKYDAFAGWEADFWFTTAIFGAKKRSPWIAKILKRYELADPEQKIKTNTFLKTVHSPSVYAQDLYNISLDGKTRVYGDGEFATFATEYFCPKHYMTGIEKITPKTIALHHYASTWHTQSERFKNFLSRSAYKIFGKKIYRRLESSFHNSLARKIHKELKWYNKTMSEKKSDVKILAFVGMCGSGKSTAIEVLTEKNIPKVYFGGVILKAIEEAGLEINPENERKFREELRAKEGKDFIVQRVVQQTKNLIEAGQKRIVLDGLYSWTEYKILRKEFPEELTVIAITAPKILRRKRLSERKERPFTMQEAANRDKTEIENLEKGGPIAIADYYIDNSGTIAEMHQKLKELLDKIEFFN